jgi:hypothetical protein
VDEKIKKLDEELARYKEQIRKTRPGPSQEAIKARAIRLLKHKRMSVPYSVSLFRPERVGNHVDVFPWAGLDYM